VKETAAMHGERNPWLVVGADSAIGGELLRRLRSDSIPTLGTTRREAASDELIRLDLAAEPTTWNLPKCAGVTFLCAAVTSIEKCRQSPAEAHLVNVERTLVLANRLGEFGTHVVFLSTNQVFDGARAFQQADAEPHPVTNYGRQKVEVERALLHKGNATVVRFTKIVPPRMKLIGEWAVSLKAGQPIRPFHDMVLSPIPLAFAAEVLRKVGERKPGGIVQVSGERDVSYADFAFTLARRLGLSLDLVQPIAVEHAGIGRDAAPVNTTLKTTRLKELGFQPPPVSDTIHALIEGAIHG
jgi:dTDP-4-dehydrorhamnose reductase